MGFKHDDACLAKVGPDEPIFVLRAKDLLAPTIVEAWIKEAQASLGPVHPKLIEARMTAARMIEWQADPKNGAKWPD